MHHSGNLLPRKIEILKWWFVSLWFGSWIFTICWVHPGVSFFKPHDLCHCAALSGMRILFVLQVPTSIPLTFRLTEVSAYRHAPCGTRRTSCPNGKRSGKRSDCQVSWWSKLGAEIGRCPKKNLGPQIIIKDSCLKPRRNDSQGNSTLSSFFMGKPKNIFFVFFKGETPMIKRIFDDLFIFFWIVGVMPGSSEPGSTSGKSPGHVQPLPGISIID